jgi:putative transposase
MQALGRHYVRYVNDTYDRSGTLWEGRYKACAVHSADYLLACMRYIELNPVRAGLADHPGGYPWSSFAANATGQADALVTEHPLYTGLGENSAARQLAYRALFTLDPDEAVFSDIRSATKSGYLLAGDAFRSDLQRANGSVVGPAPRGRPRKSVRVQQLPD